MKNILVVGGGGYIGSHTCFRLAESGYVPITYDDFSSGHREFVKWGPFEEGDIRDRRRLLQVFKQYRPLAIVHFAGLIEVGLSIRDPLAFFDVNVGGTIHLLSAAEEAGCRNIVFSSTCATYGVPRATPITESHPQVPVNPYGRSKLIVEQMLKDMAQLRGFTVAIMRYFNAAGSAFEQGIGEWHDPETHVLPLSIDVALGRRAAFYLHGCDYDTRDGSCVRDFVHVLDLADAHCLAVSYLLAGGESAELNLGTGVGTTVRELLRAVETQSGRRVTVVEGPRREGDVPVLVADNVRAAAVLGWTPRYNLSDIVLSAWNWHYGRAA